MCLNYRRIKGRKNKRKVGIIGNKNIEFMIIHATKSLSSIELLAQILANITPEEKVKITGLGIFKLRKVNPRIGRNPKTGELVQIPAKLRMSFKASKTVIDSLEEKFK